MKKKITPTKLLALCLIVFLCSMIVLNLTLTSGGSVKSVPVNFVTDENVTLEGTLFVPKTATAENPAAGIVVAPGGNTPHTFYASYCIELSRRGYVVFAYDYYGTVGSGMTTDGSSGAVAAMKYLTELSFVDTSRLGATGHSNGGGQAAAAITSEYAVSAEKKSVVFIGCGISTSAENLEGINVAAIWGKMDEAGQGTFWNTYHADKLNFGQFAEMVGVTSAEVVPGNYYSGTNGEVRVVYTPNTWHSMSNIVPSSVTNIIKYFDATLDGNTSRLSDGSHIYVWQEFAVLFAALSLCVMIFPVGSLLLDSKFFSSLKHPVREAKGVADIKFWIFLLVPAVISALLVKSTVIQGQTFLGKWPKIFNVQSTNGFIGWFFVSTLVAIVFFVIRMYIDKTVDRADAAARLKTGLKDIPKAALLAVATVGVPYLVNVLGERAVGWYGRIFQTYFASMTPTRAAYFPLYFVMFGLLFSVHTYIQADGLRLKNGSETKTYWLTFLANALPAALFVGYVFGSMFLTHITVINGREMSRANGAMMGMLLLYFVVAKNVTYFYKKTGNIYVCALLNSAFVTWLSVNTPQFMV